MKRFNLKKLNGVQVKEQYQVKILNRFPLLENLMMMMMMLTPVGLKKVLEEI
jgi:hypothetical protein